MSEDKVTKSVADAIAAQRAPPKLPRRFYSQVTTVPRGSGTDAGEVFDLQLDGRQSKTPGKSALALPGQPLAKRVAAEWNAQQPDIDLTTMPLTRLAYRAIDTVQGCEQKIRDEIVEYAGSDLLCYRADQPVELIERQTQSWDPIMAWLKDHHGIELAVATGIAPVRQSDKALAAFAEKILTTHGSAFALAGMQVMTTLCGSAILAFAHAQAHLSLEQTWRAAYIDEDWQIENWGEDDEARVARAARKADMTAASQMLDLLRDNGLKL